MRIVLVVVLVLVVGRSNVPEYEFDDEYEDDY